MDMQDKEFEELFRSKLDAFETEPSGKVWPGIVDGLDAAKRTRNRATWLSIAASVLLLAGFSAWLISKQQPGLIKTAVSGGIAKTQKPAPVGNTFAKPLKAQLPATVQPAIKPSNQVAYAEPEKDAEISAVKSADTAHIQQMLPIKRDEPLIADMPQKMPVSKPVVPDQVIQLTVKSSIDRLPGSPQLADNVAAQGKANNRTDTTTLKRKPRIHSFGDLVNLVVAKLDKRKDKLIEFTDDGDGDSNVTGVNLGIVKIKKGE